ncbi:MAG: PAS domain-containing protein [Nitrospiria bacterium]
MAQDRTRSFIELRLAKTAIQKAEERYRNIFENSGEGIFQSTPDGKLLLVNPALAIRAGFNSPEEMIKAVQDATTQYVDREDRKEMGRLLEEQGFVKDFETKLYRPDRTIVWNSMNVRAIRDSTGVIHHYDGWVEDITRRKVLIEVSHAIVSTLV